MKKRENEHTIMLMLSILCVLVILYMGEGGG